MLQPPATSQPPSQHPGIGPAALHPLQQTMRPVLGELRRGAFWGARAQAVAQRREGGRQGIQPPATALGIGSNGGKLHGKWI
jgi:hypothetical protein